MPLSLAFRFLAGRYHATPFGHHVNEGLIEWPPSPWRILRALVSVGYTSGAWDGAGPPEAARNLFEKLCSQLPHYHLPPAVGAHSRHYMPIGNLDSKTKIEKTTLVFDTWARIEAHELQVFWSNVSLADVELSTLRILLSRLNYLGRSESWIEGRVIEDGEPISERNCFPAEVGKTLGNVEQVTLLAPDRPSDFEAWRTACLDQALADLPLPEGRKPTRTLLRERSKAKEPYPADILDCMQKDTNWMRRHGWSQPPGSRRVLYRRPVNAVSTGAVAKKGPVRHEGRAEAMLLSLMNASRNDHALPPITRTMPQAELLHRALVGIAARKGAPPSELTGRDENRVPLRGPHGHAHINPLDLDDDGHLDHILIWAPGGLGTEGQAAIRAARRTFARGGIEPLRLALAATGAFTDLTRLPGVIGPRIGRLAGASSRWQSSTPFVPPRYIKRRGKNSLEGQVRAELQSRGFPDPTAVRPLELSPDRSRFRHFGLTRQHGPQPPLARGFAIHLEFGCPVTGPIAIGYGSHFGLGLFERTT